MTNTKKKRKISLLEILVYTFILAGVLVMVYPLISQFYYRYEGLEDIDKYKKGSELLDKEEIKRRMLLAEAYNDSLLDSGSRRDVEDPFSDELREEGKREYAKMLEVHEMVGVIKIPIIAQEIPVRAGTSEAVLQKSAGHMENTSLPIGGPSTHSIITAHRGLPKARLFTDLDKLKIGDRFYFTNIRETMAYQVDDIKVIEPHEFEHLDIIEGEDYMTLLTCTPYMINSHRLLVRGKRIDYFENLEKDDIASGKKFIKILLALAVVSLLFIIMTVIQIKTRKKYKELEKRLKEIEAKEKKINYEKENR